MASPYGDAQQQLTCWLLPPGAVSTAAGTGSRDVGRLIVIAKSASDEAISFIDVGDYFASLAMT